MTPTDTGDPGEVPGRAGPTAGGTAARRAARGSGGARKPEGRAPGTGSDGTTPRLSADAPRRSEAARRQLDPDALAALEEERDFLLRSLDDLEREHDAGDVDDTDYVELNDDYTARAAQALRAIEDRRALAASRRPATSWVRTLAGLGVVAVLALGVGWFVLRDSGTRSAGQGLTGSARQDSANLILQADAAINQAQIALRAGDTEEALSEYERAIKAYDDALDLSPGNAEAMTYRGWLLHNIALSSGPGAAAQLDQQARQWLDQAVATDPTYADARVFRATLARDAGNFAAAQADLVAVDRSALPPFMLSRVDGLQAEVQAGLTGSATTTTTTTTTTTGR